MGQDRIDQHIQETLFEHKTHIDSEALWQSISQTKGRRFSIFYLLSGLVFLTLLAGIYFWGSSDETNTSDFNIQEGIALNSMPESKAEGTNKFLEENNDDDEIMDFKLRSVSPKKEDKLSSYTQTVKASANHPRNTNSSGAATAQQGKSKQSISVYNEEKTDTEDALIQSNAKAVMDKDFAGKLENSTEVATEANSAETYSNQRNISLRSVSGLSIIKSRLVDNSALIGMWLKTTECPSFGKKKGSLFVEAYSLLDYAVNSYSSLPEFDAYLEERRSTQSYKPSYRAGLQFKYLFDNGFLIKAGLEYSRSREQFRYRRETVRTEIRPDQVIHVHVDMNGDTTVVLGNAPVTIIETKNWRVRNSYSSVDIPFSIGYQFDQGPWFYSAEAGIIYNLNYGFSGMLLDTTGEPVIAESYFREKTSLSYQAAFTLGYRINASWSFICRGSIRTHPGLVNSTSNVVDQSYSLIGAGVGMEYKF